jgi:hypothetical protein
MTNDNSMDNGQMTNDNSMDNGQLGCACPVRDNMFVETWVTPPPSVPLGTECERREEMWVKTKWNND